MEEQVLFLFLSGLSIPDANLIYFVGSWAKKQSHEVEALNACSASLPYVLTALEPFKIQSSPFAHKHFKIMNTL